MDAPRSPEAARRMKTTIQGSVTAPPAPSMTVVSINIVAFFLTIRPIFPFSKQCVFINRLKTLIFTLYSLCGNCLDKKGSKGPRLKSFNRNWDSQ